MSVVDRGMEKIYYHFFFLNFAIYFNNLHTWQKIGIKEKENNYADYAEIKLYIISILQGAAGPCSPALSSPRCSRTPPRAGRRGAAGRWCRSWTWPG